MSNTRTLQPEDLIAQYRVVGPLGAGGMGEVYLAQDQTLERNVALKVLPYELTRSDDRVRRFMQEAKSASSLNHPNIVTIYEIGQDPVRSTSGAPDSSPLHYISMELITGKTLGAKIHEERTDLRTLCGYLAQAAEGIAKAHAAGIVHRDLKPGNIMVSDDGFAKVLDFGLAKLTEKGGVSGPTEATEIAGRTVEGAVMGTVYYMSPEQVQAKSVDARSDIFSFGCLLYEAAVRQRPFTAESNVETMHKILHEKPRPIEEVNPSVPAELRRLIRRCLAKAPEQRAQSMKDVAIELREIVDEYDALSASATSASTIGMTPGLKPALVRPKSRVPLIAGVAVIVAALAGAAWWVSQRGGEDNASQPFQTMRVSTQTSRGDVTGASISPDGRYLGYVAGSGGRVTLRVRQVATGSDVEVLPVQDGPIEFPTFSPDGNYLFYCKRKPEAPLYRTLMSVPSLGGREQERGFDVDSRPSFSPDGKRACFTRIYPQKQYTALILLDLDTGKERELAAVTNPGGPGTPSWSPDGKFIAAPVVLPPPAGKTTVALFDPNTGSRRDIFTRDAAFFSDIAWLSDGKGFVLSGFDLATTFSNQLFTLSYPGVQLRRVTNDMNDYQQVSVGSGEEAISSVRASRLSNVHIVDTRGGSSRALTRSTSPEHSPFFMVPVGDRVYYACLHGDFSGISAVPMAGGAVVAFDTGEGHVTQLQAEGNIVLVRRLNPDQKSYIWRIDEGGTMRRVTDGGRETLLNISPDGSMFTFSRSDSSRGVYLMPSSGGEARLFSATAENNVAPFTPDGKHIVLLEYETDDKGFIRTVFELTPIDGGDPLAVLRLPQTAIEFAGVPGANAVSYVDRADPGRNIYRLDPPMETPTRVTNFTDGRVSRHAWSKDGKRVAMVRRTDDGENLWLMNADGTGLKQLTTFTGMEIFQVAWAADGTSVVVNAGTRATDVALIRNFR